MGHIKKWLAKIKKFKIKIPERVLWILLGIAFSGWLFVAMAAMFGIDMSIIIIMLILVACAGAVGFWALIGFFRSLMR